MSQADADIDPMTVSGVVRNLERRALLERRRSLNDTCAWELRLMPAGQEVFAQAFPLVEQANDKFFATLPDEDAFRSQLHALRLAAELMGETGSEA